MNKILIILSLVLLASCGSSQKDKNIAAVTCSIMSETRNMDAAIRVREMNDAREKIGGEPFLRGDSAIQEAFGLGLCQELVLGIYDETRQSLADAKRERERIADSKPSVKKQGLYESYHENGQLQSKTNYKDGKKDGREEWYHENGQFKTRDNYKNGEQDGLEEWYHDDGQLWFKECYKNGEAAEMSNCEK